MAEIVKFDIDLSGLADWAPYEGFGSNALLKLDGIYSGLIAKIQLKKSSNGSPMFLVQNIVQDEDEKGQSLLSNVMVGGTDKNGKSMVRQLGDFMASIGFSQEQIRGLAAKGAAPGEAIANACLNKVAYFEAAAETYEGKMTSKVGNYIVKQRYDDAKAANAHRRPRAADISFASAPAGVTTGPTNVGGAGALAGLTGGPANGAAKPAGAVNPMAALAGLGLNLG